jgi:membrane protease YdiL (CAAX protease family)
MTASNRALAVFLAIACIPTWTAWSLIAFHLVPANAPWVQALYLVGWSCSLAGLIATGLLQGRPGVRRLLGEAVRVRAAPGWWLFALGAPFAVAAVRAYAYAWLSGRSVAFTPEALAALASPAMIAPFFFGPFGEEFGWRGYLLPELMRRLPVLGACGLVGIIWGLWHWPLFYQGIASSGPEGALVRVAGIAALSFVIGAVYLNTKSLLLAMLMHWSFNASVDLSGKLFAGLPDEAAAPALRWIGLAVIVIFAGACVPALLSAERRGAGSVLPAQLM